jgi:hypothetical protein
MPSPWTVFTWGYAGWGNATRELDQAFSTVERARGHEPPVFADVRVRREVRAVGFRGDAFARRVGRERYRWLPGLGNARVATGQGAMRLVHPEDVYELLGLIQAQRQRGRRVVLFCSCGSPFEAPHCHRQLVRRELLSAARASGVALGAEEWPGGALPSAAEEELSVTPQTLASLRAGALALRLGARLPEPRLLAWPTGAVLRLRAEEDSQFVSLAPAHFHAGTWRMPLYLHPVEPLDSRPLLRRQSRQCRREGLLERHVK